MSRLLQITMNTLLGGLLLTAVADDRRAAAPSYDATDQAPAGSVLTAESAAGVVAYDYSPSPELQQLRSEWMARYRALEAEILDTEDKALVLELERQMMVEQAAHDRAELELLLTEAVAAGNERYADNLRRAIANGLEPTRTATAGATIPRDPDTGRALAGEEGGVK